MFKKIGALCMCIVIIVLVCGCAKSDNKKPGVVATVFAEYDFARAVCGNKADVRLLLLPGSDVHSYEPTFSDVVSINNASVFLYIGGESETWVEKILKSANKDLITLKMADTVPLLAEDDEPDEYDEHIWTSPENAKIMVNAICEKMCLADPDNSQYFKQNAEDYCKKITAADEKIKSVLKDVENPYIVVADRFPLTYFADYYGIGYSAAFAGCDADTDADLLTVMHLIDDVKVHNLKVVYKIELSNGAVAKTVAESTGAAVEELHSAHNISARDFAAGITYADIMLNNASALERGFKK